MKPSSCPSFQIAAHTPPKSSAHFLIYLIAMFERIRRIFGHGQTHSLFPPMDPENKDWMAFRRRREEKYSPMSRIDDFENSGELWSRYERIRLIMHEGDAFVAQVKHIFDENTHRMNGRDKYDMALNFKSLGEDALRMATRGITLQRAIDYRERALRMLNSARSRIKLIEMDEMKTENFSEKTASSVTVEKSSIQAIGSDLDAEGVWWK